MNPLLETLLTALVLSALAAGCLALLPQAPPRLRFAVAAAGLSAWLVPWGAIDIALPAGAVPSFTAPLTEALRTAAQLGSLPVGLELDVAGLLGSLFAAASLVGIVLFVGDCLALERSVRAWRAASRPGDDLRTLLPPELTAVPAEIRIVANSRVAAASGLRRPTIWIGDHYTGEQRRLVVVHEMWHVRGRDPLWIALLSAVRRLYWWNPLVAHFARHASLMIESTCDHRSAAHFDKPRYISELASLVLAAATPAQRLIATARTGNLDVERLRLLGTSLRLRARDVAVLAAFSVSAAATAMCNVVELDAPLARETSSSAVFAGASAAARFASPRSPVAHDSDLLDDSLRAYDYMPQQYSGDLGLQP